jgi:hypothetical protein
MAANEGKYSEANEYLSSEMKQVTQGPLGAMAGGTKGIWDKYTKNGIKRFKNLKNSRRS